MRFDSDHNHNNDLPVPPQLLQNWSEHTDSGSALQELLINFYFKGGNKNLGCEFLHKSFREYLYAEAIYYALLDSAKNTPEYFKPARDYEYWQDFEPGSPEYNLSRRLSYLLGPQWLTTEVRGHLFWLIEQDIESQQDIDRQQDIESQKGANIKRNKESQQSTTNWLWLRDALLSVYAWWAEGVLNRHQPKKQRGQDSWQAPFIDELFLLTTSFETKSQPPMRTSVLDAHLGHALMQLTALVFNKTTLCKNPSLSHSREANYCQENQLIKKEHKEKEHKEKKHKEKSIYFRPGGEGFFNEMISRFDSEGWRKSRGLGLMILPGADLFKENLSVTNAQSVDLREGVMVAADLRHADLTDADLRYADLRHANLRHANLRHADLRKADLRKADLRNADLTRANLTRAYLIDAYLTRAYLIDAYLSHADLTHADLTHADLRNANLRLAYLINADLRNADLRNADLRNADLRNADLRNADLRNANLINADLTHADLTNANFTGARLAGTILEDQELDENGRVKNLDKYGRIKI